MTTQVRSNSPKRAKLKGPEKIGTVLTQLLENTGLNQKIDEQKSLLIWDKVVGKTIALHTTPGWVKNKILWVLVDDAIWQQELTFLETQIMEKINQQLGGKQICKIKFLQKRARENIQPNK